MSKQSQVNSANAYMEHNRKQADAYRARRAAAVEALVDFFLDTRGCSRLIAAGYALQAVKMRYDEISSNVKQDRL